MTGTPEELIKYLFSLDKTKKYTISEFKEKRSLKANAYCWELLGKIANIVGTTKEEVYRDFIKNKGIYRIITINEEALPTFIKIWTSRGLGWLCDKSENNIKGLVDVIAYYGTSSYNSKQMSYFVDYVVQEEKNLGIETLTPEEIETMKLDWKVN